MNKYKLYFIALVSLLISAACHKDDDSVTYETLRAYADQYSQDHRYITDYLKSHYIKEVVDAPGMPEDQDIVMDSIPPNNPDHLTSIWYDSRLDSVAVDLHDITYKLYYFKARIGTGDSPCRVDQVLPAYDGSYLGYITKSVDQLDENGSPVLNPDGTHVKEQKAILSKTRFEYVPFPNGFVKLDEVISGWSEILPHFKAGTVEVVDGQPTIYRDFGAGIMFIPSGLAYYNVALVNIPSYSPLIFTFKMYRVTRADQDGDGILSIDEDLNHDGIFTNDDTDGDGIQDYKDFDDDGDSYLTRNETMIPNSSPAAYYPYNPTDSQPLGIPDCSGNYTDPARKRKYLDPSCH